MCKVLENKYNRDTDTDTGIVLHIVSHARSQNTRETISLGCISQKRIEKRKYD